MGIRLAIATGAAVLGMTATGAAANTTHPVCAAHNPTAYHGLVNPVRHCHYTHEHKDNPNVLNRRFGKVGSAWGSRQSISYPWQTFKGATEGFPRRPAASAGLLENQTKHQGYGWGVRKDLRCVPASDAQGCLTDIRYQVHALPTHHDATTRFHSFWIEARGCIAGRCGTIKEGGWIDYGVLRLDPELPSAVRHVPLPGDAAVPPDNNPQRLHKTLATNQRDATWYSQGGLWNKHRTWLGLRFESIAPIDPADPFRPLDYCSVDGHAKGACEWNGSWLEVHLVPIYITPELDRLDGKVDGLVTLRRHTDRWGNIRRKKDCRKAGLDCVPLIIDKMPVGAYQYRDDTYGKGPVEHDVSPGQRRVALNGQVLGPASWWIGYPTVR